MNIEKCKTMIMSPGKNVRITIEGQELEEGDKIYHFGQSDRRVGNNREKVGQAGRLYL